MQLRPTVNRDKDGRSANAQRASVKNSRSTPIGVNVTEVILVYNRIAPITMEIDRNDSFAEKPAIGTLPGRAAEDLTLISKSRTWTAFWGNREDSRSLGT